jgi:menaquinone-dependent protoporphyrinogen oxidase
LETIMRILILYGTSEGQTRKIASFVADRCRAAGHDVKLVDATDRHTSVRAADFDATIIAARVHAGTYQRAVLAFARDNRHILGIMPNAFLSVSMSAARLSPMDGTRLESYIAGFTRRTGWSPEQVLHVAGARLYTRHNAVGRWIFGLIDGHRFPTDRDHEWTNWRALERFADEFLARARDTGTVTIEPGFASPAHHHPAPHPNQA